jgi:hypothetical protein
VGRLEEAGLGLARVGEGAPFEAEQLGLEQGLRDCSAVDLDERPRGPRAGPVNGAGHEPLARAGLPLDQKRRQAPPLDAVGEQPLHRGADGLDRRTLPEQLGQGRHGGYSTPSPPVRRPSRAAAGRLRAGWRPARRRLTPRLRARAAGRAPARADLRLDLLLRPHRVLGVRSWLGAATPPVWPNGR